jgi:hypothetical protein
MDPYPVVAMPRSRRDGTIWGSHAEASNRRSVRKHERGRRRGSRRGSRRGRRRGSRR